MRDTYEKTVWVDGKTKLDAAKLNNIEEGIENLFESSLTVSDFKASDGLKVDITENREILIHTEEGYYLTSEETKEVINSAKNDVLDTVNESISNVVTEFNESLEDYTTLDKLSEELDKKENSGYSYSKTEIDEKLDEINGSIEGLDVRVENLETKIEELEKKISELPEGGNKEPEENPEEKDPEDEEKEDEPTIDPDPTPSEPEEIEGVKIAGELSYITKVPADGGTITPTSVPFITKNGEVVEGVTFIYSLPSNTFATINDSTGKVTFLDHTDYLERTITVTAKCIYEGTLYTTTATVTQEAFNDDYNLIKSFYYETDVESEGGIAKAVYELSPLVTNLTFTVTSMPRGCGISYWGDVTFGNSESTEERVIEVTAKCTYKNKVYTKTAYATQKSVVLPTIEFEGEFLYDTTKVISSEGGSIEPISIPNLLIDGVVFNGVSFEYYFTDEENIGYAIIDSTGKIFFNVNESTDPRELEVNVKCLYKGQTYVKTTTVSQEGTIPAPVIELVGQFEYLSTAGSEENLQITPIKELAIQVDGVKLVETPEIQYTIEDKPDWCSINSETGEVTFDKSYSLTDRVVNVIAQCTYEDVLYELTAEAKQDAYVDVELVGEFSYREALPTGDVVEPLNNLSLLVNGEPVNVELQFLPETGEFFNIDSLGKITFEPSPETIKRNVLVTAKCVYNDKTLEKTAIASQSASSIIFEGKLEYAEAKFNGGYLYPTSTPKLYINGEEDLENTTITYRLLEEKDYAILDSNNGYLEFRPSEEFVKRGVTVIIEFTYNGETYSDLAWVTQEAFIEHKVLLIGNFEYTSKAGYNGSLLVPTNNLMLTIDGKEASSEDYTVEYSVDKDFAQVGEKGALTFLPSDTTSERSVKVTAIFNYNGEILEKTAIATQEACIVVKIVGNFEYPVISAAGELTCYPTILDLYINDKKQVGAEFIYSIVGEKPTWITSFDSKNGFIEFAPNYSTNLRYVQISAKYIYDGRTYEKLSNKVIQRGLGEDDISGVHLDGINGELIYSDIDYMGGIVEPITNTIKLYLGNEEQIIPATYNTDNENITVNEYGQLVVPENESVEDLEFKVSVEYRLNGEYYNYTTTVKQFHKPIIKLSDNLEYDLISADGGDISPINEITLTIDGETVVDAILEYKILESTNENIVINSQTGTITFPSTDNTDSDLSDSATIICQCIYENITYYTNRIVIIQSIRQ